jgi:hypothetical protein
MNDSSPACSLCVLHPHQKLKALAATLPVLVLFLSLSDGFATGNYLKENYMLTLMNIRPAVPFAPCYPPMINLGDAFF